MENAQAHAKRLILVNGPMGVGKTAVCRQLVRLCAPAAFLDGDWCWMLEPFTVTPETKELVLSNIAHMLESYGRCTACRTVVFCWVMQTPDIVQQVLGRLPAGLFSPRLITLMASPEALAARVQKDVDARLRGADALAAHCATAKSMPGRPARWTPRTFHPARRPPPCWRRCNREKSRKAPALSVLTQSALPLKQA